MKVLFQTALSTRVFQGTYLDVAFGYDDLEDLNVKTVINLLEAHDKDDDERKSYWISHGINEIRFPIQDYQVPSSMESFLDLTTQMLTALKIGNLLIHCRGGFGRTGLVACCLYSALTANTSGQHVMATLREKAPGLVETLKQEAFVKTFASDHAVSFGMEKEGFLPLKI